MSFSLLLTGTPIQNSLQELYSLLSFIEPDIFPNDQVDEFVQYYHEIKTESKSGKQRAIKYSASKSGRYLAILQGIVSYH